MARSKPATPMARRGSTPLFATVGDGTRRTARIQRRFRSGMDASLRGPFRFDREPLPDGGGVRFAQGDGQVPGLTGILTLAQDP